MSKAKKDKKDSHAKGDDTRSDEDFSSEDDMDEDGATWIAWFCSLKGNEFYCEVDEEFIRDDFNLTNLRNQVPNYDYALDMILDDDSDEILSPDQAEIVEGAAEFLYGLIHARFILTTRGMGCMAEKYQDAEFGREKLCSEWLKLFRCPRVLCQGQPVLPCGMSDIPRTNTVKMYCPLCKELYYPRQRKHQVIDGAFFGTTFPHLLLQCYPELWPPGEPLKYIPKIYGFKIHSSARQRQDDIKQQQQQQQEKVRQLQQARAKQQKLDSQNSNFSSNQTADNKTSKKKK